MDYNKLFLIAGYDYNIDELDLGQQQFVLFVRGLLS